MTTLKKNLESNDRIQLYKQRNLYRTLDDVRNDPGPTLEEIARDDENRVYTLIIQHIVQLNEFLNIRVKMTREQIIETAVMVYSYYPKYKEADLICFFSQVKRGRYGEMFESLDGMKLMNWLSQYDNIRSPKLRIY